MENPIELKDLHVSVWNKFIIWLKWTLTLLGICFINVLGYFCYYGLPNCMRTLDAQLQQERIDQLGQAVVELQDFKQVVTMKEEAAKVKLARK